MDRFPRSDSIVQQTRSGLQTYMAQVYGWMTVGLLLTAFIAWYAANTPELMMFIFSSKITFFGLIIAQLALVFVLSGLVQKLSAGMATTLFMLYSALTGLTLSSIFIVYTYSSIASTFVVTGGMFGAMSLYGYTTKRDLSGFGSMLFMGLIGIVLASLVNLWLKSEALMWAVTYIGVVVFVGLTAYDTQKLKNIGEQIDVRGLRNANRRSGKAKPPPDLFTSLTSSHSSPVVSSPDSPAPDNRPWPAPAAGSNRACGRRAGRQ